MAQIADVLLTACVVTNVHFELAHHILQTIVMKQQLTASKVFSSMTIFDMLSNELDRLMEMLTQIPAGKASLDRLTAFLREVCSQALNHASTHQRA